MTPAMVISTKLAEEFCAHDHFPHEVCTVTTQINPRLNTMF